MVPPVGRSNALQKVNKTGLLRPSILRYAADFVADSRTADNVSDWCRFGGGAATSEVDGLVLFPDHVHGVHPLQRRG